MAALRERVLEVIERKVRPAIKDDGGDIEVVGVDEKERIVMVRLSGACEGCSAANVTLEGWVEELIKRELPEVKRVIPWIFATGPIPHPSERKSHPPPKGESPAARLKRP
jgi:Fe-S cluster biogenesis protein NfuA